MDILRVEHLVKSFGRTRIIKDISFSVGSGEIVGFVGPNGAGKTTTLKLVTNLIFPDSGRITVSGFDLLKERENALSHLSGIIENPGLYTGLTGKENLDFIRRLRGVSREKYDEVVEITGLGDRLSRKVKKYSLGMKQRLAIGMCLLSSPDFLILDEPTNGLDPTGTMELRELIVKMAKEYGVSVLFSSHMLDEVGRISDRVIYIKDGELLGERTREEMFAGERYLLAVDNAERAVQLLAALPSVLSCKSAGENRLRVESQKNTVGELAAALLAGGIVLSDIQKESDQLENIYREIFKEGEK
ncbi:MAG: ABC transporter ATP-binding protein [Oscillospiraceae bacterium]|nr:ABC transporter ATP-binding protein [Oscillospiraceae bacterium]MDY3065218.1 ABC transporter ATP-binding protein [Oscillospiraceae bacterium]